MSDVEDDGAVAPLTPEDEAHVHDLLAALPDPELPPEVRDRIAAALAADPGASATILPADRATPRAALPGPPSGRWRHPRLLQAAAGLVILALVGATAWGLVEASSGNSGGPGTVAGSDGATTPVTTSGTAYTQANLSREVATLLSGEQSGSDSASGVTAATEQLSAATASAVTALMEDTQSRQRCLDELSGVPGEQALAVDVGTFNAKPAAVIVLPSADDPNALDVWVVGPTCSDADNPFPYQYQPLPRP